MTARYHVVGAHGGAWIYEVDSHEEFERLLATAPVFDFATYTCARSPTCRDQTRAGHGAEAAP